MGRKWVVFLSGLSLVFFFGFLRTSAWAQSFSFDFGTTYVWETENKDNDTKIQRTLAWIGGKYSTPLSPDFTLTAGLSYEGQFVDYSDFRPVVFQGRVIQEGDLPENLHAIDATLALNWRWSDAWSTTFSFNPGIHSDFEDISGKDFIYQGSILFQNRLGGKNLIGFGLAYSDSFGDPLVIPLVQIRWYPTPEWYVESMLPLNLNVGYNLDSTWSVGLEGKLRGYRYRLTESAPWNEAVLKYREVQLGPFLNARLGEKVSLRLSAGVVVAQKFEFMDKDSDNTIVEGKFKNTGYVTVRLFALF